jgi:hypothetical protein
VGTRLTGVGAVVVVVVVELVLLEELLLAQAMRTRTLAEAASRAIRLE